MSNEILHFPKQRKHTYHFLDHAKEFSPVYLSIDVDFYNIQKVRKNLVTEKKIKISYIAFIIKGISEVLRKYPKANSAVKGSLFPKIAFYEDIIAKFTLDKTIDNERVVLAGKVINSDHKSLEEIQEDLEYYKNSTFQEVDEFQPIQKLHSLPTWLGNMIYKKTVGDLKKRHTIQGTFTITSLGHRPIKHFYPITSATLCFGIGAIEEKTKVINNTIEIRPIMPICLTFDHRAIDGALAADILTGIKNQLENWGN
ncbi:MULTISPECIES: 2-oxo acid dehydrogenase subunit E2 [Metabacillus]|jgi:pyruvate/2-oxoglutarate dehydrogenase complex dihydrolipoamide acyltransferase (E2) component|uniref:2-oxo acid dehydrogenase subunit E2 n=1 Tax=Metabacillus rhizolycopersici TaxID=2875709 RepID=A0ABS7UQN7_9BACI|nr:MULTISPECIES: 2-oxo acid dehydrogenase subunit E2 [Metabacillus]MBZ5750620.1 2-oxo acid dehydrogenase subunit E2 [Metabacillus rhizolycopersici]MCM3651759.1 2-oxo acid dehydrogenase subunit E2 [Metabacillus litoralis]